jgi:biotin carboxyl carrier protein
MADGAARRQLARLADEVLPVLIARLEASGLSELEVREKGWRVRLRRALSVASPTGQRGREGPSPGAPADRGAARGPSPRLRRPYGPTAAGRRGTPSGNGEYSPVAAVGPGGQQLTGGRPASGASPERRRVVARAPAVGYYIPRDGLGTGTAVATDEVVGEIEVLGVRQEVVAPARGVVSRILVEPGEAVEYGQELLQIDVVAGAGGPSAGDQARDASVS